jgi:colanic acid/amylovoran biosynthesis protein
MKITIIHAHWQNRGDEAALRALVDELRDIYPNAHIYIQIITTEVKQFPYNDSHIHVSNVIFPKNKNRFDYWLAYLTKGRICLFDNTKAFIDLVKDSDIVLHGPGGPSIGDIYFANEERYLKRLDLVRAMGIKYAFYAPSMGPFRSNNEKRNILRKRVLDNAEFVCLREAVSAQYVKEFGVDNEIFVTLDSAFQHYGDPQKYEQQFMEYSELNEFMTKYDKIVGMTTTDLAWHPIHKNNMQLREEIKETFTTFIDYLKEKNIGVVFIPQLFGNHHDKKYMELFKDDNCFVVDDLHDCYFQQHIISKFYSVVGMRYHSNIFSAKMGTPFISISYEQKMAGFMEISGLDDYCIKVEELNAKGLIETFEKLENNYESYRKLLNGKIKQWKKEAHRTTDAVTKILNEA